MNAEAAMPIAPPSRREFLYYLGGASAALFSVGTCGLLYQYITRNVPLEQQEDVYEVDMAMLSTDFRATGIVEAKAFLSKLDDGLVALNGICTFRYKSSHYDMASVKWVEIYNAFACPICGSRYELDGIYIHGPAQRSLDRYGMWVRTAEGRLVASKGEPISVENAAQIFIDTRVIIRGQPHS